MTGEERPPSSNRRLRRQADRSFLLLAIFTLVVVGGASITLIFGPATLVTALPCLLGGAAMILLPWLLLNTLERWRDRVEQS